MASTEHGFLKDRANFISIDFLRGSMGTQLTDENIDQGPDEGLNRLPTDHELARLQLTTIQYYLHETNPANGLVRIKRLLELLAASPSLAFV
jgi:hypothetical protein